MKFFEKQHQHEHILSSYPCANTKMNLLFLSFYFTRGAWQQRWRSYCKLVFQNGFWAAKHTWTVGKLGDNFKSFSLFFLLVQMFNLFLWPKGTAESPCLDKHSLDIEHEKFRCISEITVNPHIYLETRFLIQRIIHKCLQEWWFNAMHTELTTQIHCSFVAISRWTEMKCLPNQRDDFSKIKSNM